MPFTGIFVPLPCILRLISRSIRMQFINVLPSFVFCINFSLRCDSTRFASTTTSSPISTSIKSKSPFSLQPSLFTSTHTGIFPIVADGNIFNPAAAFFACLPVSNSAPICSIPLCERRCTDRKPSIELNSIVTVAQPIGPIARFWCALTMTMCGGSWHAVRVIGAPL